MSTSANGSLQLPQLPPTDIYRWKDYPCYPPVGKQSSHPSHTQNVNGTCILGRSAPSDQLIPLNFNDKLLQVPHQNYFVYWSPIPQLQFTVAPN